MDAIVQDVEFAKRLRRIMTHAGMTPRDLARAANVAEATVYRHLSATRTQPESATITAYAGALRVTADELLGLDPNEKPTGLIEVPPGDWVTIPMLTSAAGMDGGEEISVPALCLPNGVDHDRLAALTVADDACAPDLCQDDLAIIARDHPWSDGDLIVVSLDDQLVVRRGYQEGTEVMVVGADLSDRRRLARDQIVGRVMSCLHHF